MIRINQIKLLIDHSEDQLKGKIAQVLKVDKKEIIKFNIVRQSVDARKKPELFFVYTVDIWVKDENGLKKRLQKSKDKDKFQFLSEEKYIFPESGNKKGMRPVIIGLGPAGLFCAYYLALHNYKPLVFERGQDVDKRTEAVKEFWESGKLMPNSNVQFGEGGAGTFSDGKLNTLVKDKSGRNKEVLETLVKFGAKPSIVYEAKPHIGTDVLCQVVKNMRQEIIRLGGEIYFESQVTDLKIENNKLAGIEINSEDFIQCDCAVLAIGHSARDTFEMLYDKNLYMEQKSFAVGFRVEHKQGDMNLNQYGIENPPEVLGAAAYKVTAKAGARGVYSFCMCPGGYVVNASSEEKRLAVNGMSYSKRDGDNSNSAIIVSVGPEDFESDHPLAGMWFQRKLEENAYKAGGGVVPVERFGAFEDSVVNNIKYKEFSEEYLLALNDTELQPNIKGKYAYSDLSGIFTDPINKAFVEGMHSFGKSIKGFDDKKVILSGVESRTSSPVRISRDEKLLSSVDGLYPCGEGAGYAGGITSAAMDGIKVAEAIAMEFAPV